MFTIPAPNAVLFNRETKVSAEVVDFADGVIGDSGHCLRWNKSEGGRVTLGKVRHEFFF
jgi:hypothetical protein